MRLARPAPADRAAGGRRREAPEPLPGRLHRAARRRACKADYIGLFAVTAGLGVEKKEAQFLADHDDYSAIMLKALADRLAEAFAERLHQRVRKRVVGLRGRRVAEQRSADRREVPRHPPRARLPGLPRPLRQARDVPRAGRPSDIGMGLTESLAMTPAASVSGFYLAHPEATYFNVGPIGDDQLATGRGATRSTKPAPDARWRRSSPDPTQPHMQHLPAMAAWALASARDDRSSRAAARGRGRRVRRPGDRVAVSAPRWDGGHRLAVAGGADGGHRGVAVRGAGQPDGAALGGGRLATRSRPWSGIACARWVGPPALAAALAVGSAIALMFALRCLHPPGGACALLATLTGMTDPSFALFPVLTNSLLLVVASLAYNRATRRAPPARAARRAAGARRAEVKPSTPTSTPSWPATTTCSTSAAKSSRPCSRTPSCAPTSASWRTSVAATSCRAS